ncbi:diguanylate cyclase/phosphodiesterase domain-containing protein [Salmonella enterica subsp. diarizonae]|uniref:Anti-FlhC(2)FlhD(4) factor YdiV n=1 Tax=Salmonella diarizonae TaxID=59204 RepID=A0A379U3M7_SALDZ|nr:diguanylate cyclase/phosphodiesterase domain-containing protein [Salmonella enterica subsp. diarizonae]
MSLRYIINLFFNVKRGSCGGVEALMRWPQPDGRFMTPDIFITAAEMKE